MSNPISRFFKSREAVHVREAIRTHGIFVIEPTTCCAECGGYFRTEKMKTIVRGETVLKQDRGVGLPHFESVSYCQGCKPLATIIFVLRDTQGEVLDRRFFTADNGWFQDVDERTGEDRYVVSLDEYNHTFCGECGELIEETECQDCRKPKKAEK
jgi:hypothetical protein